MDEQAEGSIHIVDDLRFAAGQDPGDQPCLFEMRGKHKKTVIFVGGNGFFRIFATDKVLRER